MRIQMLNIQIHIQMHLHLLPSLMSTGLNDIEINYSYTANL